jgi:hypothetical protein
MRCLYSPVKDRRLASATTSGFGRGEAGGWRATGETEAIPLFFTLISVLALLTNYDRENCLINVGTEGTLLPSRQSATGSRSQMIIQAIPADLLFRTSHSESNSDRV